MVVAKNDAAHQELSRQFHDREVEKEYFALVWGTVNAGKRIDAPIGRDPATGRRCRRGRGARAAPVTRVMRAEHLRGVTLIQVAIATGRTHQIRVHLNAIGHPIVGDPTYGGVRRHVPERRPRGAAPGAPVPARLEARVHASHRRAGRLEFESPLPADLQGVIDAIREKQSDSDGRPQ
jgi:23S rRNA pseudouridine1911/1915/1917 synthase